MGFFCCWSKALPSFKFSTFNCTIFWGQRLVFSIMQVSLYGALYVGHLLNRWGDLFVLKMYLNANNVLNYSNIIYIYLYDKII